jgi:hypothetical protein
LVGPIAHRSHWVAAQEVFPYPKTGYRIRHNPRPRPWCSNREQFARHILQSAPGKRLAGMAAEGETRGCRSGELNQAPSGPRAEKGSRPRPPVPSPGQSLYPFGWLRCQRQAVSMIGRSSG